MEQISPGCRTKCQSYIQVPNSLQLIPKKCSRQSFQALCLLIIFFIFLEIMKHSMTSSFKSEKSKCNILNIKTGVYLQLFEKFHRRS